MLSNRRIVIIGAGHVGTHCAAALSFQNICDEIVFIDREPELMIKDFKEGKLFGERYMNSRIMNKNFEENTLKTYREISLDYLEKYNNVRIIQRD